MFDTASPRDPVERLGRRIVMFTLIVAVLAAIVAIWIWKNPQGSTSADLNAAMIHNTRGVALMEQRKDAEAEVEFEKAIAAAPDWLPARINQGMALFNQQPADTKELATQVKKAQQVFADVLTKEPKNPYALYCLGMIDMYIGKYADAYPRFQIVNQLDPNDAHTWLRLGSTHPDGPDSKAAGECYEKAVALDPYLIEAKYKLFIVLRDSDPKRADSLLTEHELLREADRFTESRIVYGEMGKYAEVIGQDVAPIEARERTLPFLWNSVPAAVTLAAGVTWADQPRPETSAGQRFGRTMLFMDFNGDGRADVLLLGAVRDKGIIRDLLLRNDGDAKFMDVTDSFGLAGDRASLGAAAGDFDNDGKPDLVITTANGVKLFRNSGERFDDVTEKAGLKTVVGLHLGATWADVDLDGDLDLMVCQSGEKGGVHVYENVGVAPPAAANGPAPPLTVAFKRSEAFKTIFPVGPAVSVLATDIDDDKDLDLIAFYDDKPPIVAFNDRLMRWHAGTIPGRKDSGMPGVAGAIADLNRDGRSDLLLLTTGTPEIYLSEGSRSFSLGSPDKPLPANLRQAIVGDWNLDGAPDVIAWDRTAGISQLANDGRGVFNVSEFKASANCLALASADLDGDGRSDILSWNANGLELFINKSSGNALVITPTGRRDKGSNLRTTNDAHGAWIIAQTGRHWAGAERTTSSAGLGQSLLPTVLGMGKHTQADALRVRWPDNVIQAEINVPTGTPYKLVETNRKGTSCPVLSVWDGEKFAFVTDFLGAGALGECGPDGSVRPPRGEESVLIGPGRMRPKNGELILKIAEPMDEVLYLDHLRLAVIDHPPTTVVLPDERFVFSGPQPTQKLLSFASQHRPIKAVDHTGKDVMSAIIKTDRQAVDNFKTRSWLGYAEEHTLTLDFGSLPKADRWHLVLSGWTEYPYPESMYAATTAGIALLPPVLEQLTNGKWEKVCDLGFPAGLPRTMTSPLPASPTGPLRIRTNMQVYWDEIFIAPAVDAESVTLDVKRADLAARGFMKEILPGGQPPVAYDDAKTDPPVATRWKGKLTRLGDVTELLTGFDDRFVLCGPGDEVTVRFDVSKLPAVKEGWSRSYVLISKGYCKDTSTTTMTGGTVGPIPFRGMPNYPDFGTAKPPITDADRWQTRWAR